MKKIVAKQKAGGPLCLEPDCDVWRLFLYAMKSPVTRDKYQRRLSRFFEFAGVEGASLVQEKPVVFKWKGKGEEEEDKKKVKANEHHL